MHDPFGEHEATARAIIAQIVDVAGGEQVMHIRTNIDARQPGDVGDVVHRLSVEFDGQQHIAEAEDLYTAACELAQMVGIELDDG